LHTEEFEQRHDLIAHRMNGAISDLRDLRIGFPRTQQAQVLDLNEGQPTAQRMPAEHAAAGPDPRRFCQGGGCRFEVPPKGILGGGNPHHA
jgi:hypothetical protein